MINQLTMGNMKKYDFDELIRLINDHQIHGNRYELELFFYFIVKISNNYHRNNDFFNK